MELDKVPSNVTELGFVTKPGCNECLRFGLLSLLVTD